MNIVFKKSSRNNPEQFKEIREKAEYNKRLLNKIITIKPNKNESGGLSIVENPQKSGHLSITDSNNGKLSYPE